MDKTTLFIQKMRTSLIGALMIYLDAIWDSKRKVMISGEFHWIPFGVDLPPKLCSFITQWIDSSGASWTVERLKDLTLWSINLLAGNHEFTLPWFKVIRYKGYMIPKLDLFIYLIDNLNHPNQVRLVLMVLKSYRLRTWGTPSLDSIDGTAKVPNTRNYVRILRNYVQLPRVPSSVLGRTDAIDTRKSYCSDSGRTHPGPYGLLDEAFPAEIRFLYEDLNRDPLVLGKLVAVPDKGKWRTILVGHWAIQLQTKRLADWLRSWLWEQPEIASGDQKRMSKFAIDSLEKGRYMLSIDLSQATDRLSAEFQIQLLVSMGVPERYFKFLSLPAYFSPKEFGRGDSSKLKKIRYTNGQPMGLFLSFPMFELMHFIILKYVVATTDATFCICGDDVMIACNHGDHQELFERYQTLIERFGGDISLRKTIASNKLAEGVGAIFLKGYPKELRIPSGKLSALEASSPGTWLHKAIKEETCVGRAIHYSWLSTQEWKEYSYSNRRALNERLMLEDLSDWSEEAVRSLADHESFPMRWYSWEEPPTGIGLNNPVFPEDEELTDYPIEIARSAISYRWIPPWKYHDSLVSHKLISLYKERKGSANETQRTTGP
jgi:hypothetical protein